MVLGNLKPILGDKKLKAENNLDRVDTYHKKQSCTTDNL